MEFRRHSLPIRALAGVLGTGALATGPSFAHDLVTSWQSLGDLRDVHARRRFERHCWTVVDLCGLSREGASLARANE